MQKNKTNKLYVIKRTISLFFAASIPLALIVYCVYYLYGDDCINCFDAKINHFFVLLVALILTSLAWLLMMIFNPPKKKKNGKPNSYYLIKNKLKIKT